MMAHWRQLIKWWAKCRDDRRWRRLRKHWPAINDIAAAAWRAGWNCERWDADLVDRFFVWVPDEIIAEHGAFVLQKLRGAYFDGAIEKNMELEDDARVEATRWARAATWN